LWSAVSTRHQDKQKKHRGDAIRFNMYESSICIHDFVDPNLPTAKANLHELLHCRLPLLTNEVSLGYDRPF
jgi:hypothetical protein